MAEGNCDAMTSTLLLNNFDILADERPDLAATLQRLSNWLAAHPDSILIDPGEMARQLRDVDAVELALALRFLVEKGILRQTYMVTAPSGDLADGEFADPRQVPAKLFDRFHRPFETSEANIVAVLVK